MLEFDLIFLEKTGRKRGKGIEKGKTIYLNPVIFAIWAGEVGLRVYELSRKIYDSFQVNWYKLFWNDSTSRLKFYLVD